MKKTKIAALITAAALTGSALPAVGASAERIALVFEFETEGLSGCKESAITWDHIDEDGFGNLCDMSGWSGDYYVFIDQKGAKASVTVDVPKDGFYALGICYIQCYGNPEKPDKTQYLLVNGESQGEVLFPFNSGKGWEELPAGYVHLDKGENTITIESYWGYTFLDYITLTDAPAYLTDFSPAETPCDPKATPEARKLYAYLRSVYGKHIISGQQEYCGSHCYNKNAYESTGKPINYLEDNEAEFDFLQETTGKQPAIRGIDFLFYNTTEPYFDDAPERVVAWYKDKGGIPTVTYHWNVPLEEGSNKAAFYVPSTGNTPATTFSVTNAVKEGTWEHEQIDKDIALLAEQLKKASDAGVPILFRPLHEAEGGWFWWGAEGPEPCVKLYRYLYDQLTNKYNLHNLLWTWTCSTSAHAAEWYPGDAYVDFQGCDKYNAINNSEPNFSAISATFYSMVAQTEGQKMVVMSENDTIPSLDNLVNDKAAWLYFCPWYNRWLTGLNDPGELKKLYNSEYCITLDELPDWNTYDPELPASTTASASSSEKTETTTTAAAGRALRGDVDCSGEVALRDAVMLAKASAGIGETLSVMGRKNADCDGNDEINSTDLKLLLQFLAGSLSLSEFNGEA